MKRSKSIKLVAMGLAPFALTACSQDPVDALVYKDVAECARDNRLPLTRCEDEYQRALYAHKNSAPKYDRQEACEQEYGVDRCEPLVTGGGNYFIPIMAGFMAPMMMQRSSGYRGGMVYTQPLYYHRDHWGQYRTSDNYRIPGRSGQVQAPAKTQRPPSIKTRSVSRGGFGSKASARGGWGSSRSRSWGG